VINAIYSLFLRNGIKRKYDGRRRRDDNPTGKNENLVEKCKPGRNNQFGSL
jgi:hypothetical protein